MLFDLLVLDGGLNDQLTVLESLVILARGDLFQGAFNVGVGELVVLDQAVHVLFDTGEGAFENVRVGIGQDYVETGNGAYVGDALAHLANADDADFFDV